MVKESIIHQIPVCGGALALDFLNTVSEWTPAPGTDYLQSYGDFRLWTERLNVLTKREYHRYARYVKKAGFNERAALKQIREARVILFQVFQGIAQGHRIPDDALNQFNSWLKKVNSRRELLNGDAGEVAVTFSDHHPELLPLWHVFLRSEKLILDHASWKRIRMCPACGWFFLDTSKGGKRKWCDMLVCGSRDKALRYYYNSKE